MGFKIKATLVFAVIVVKMEGKIQGEDALRALQTEKEELLQANNPMCFDFSDAKRVGPEIAEELGRLVAEIEQKGGQINAFGLHVKMTRVLESGDVRAAFRNKVYGTVGEATAQFTRLPIPPIPQTESVAQVTSNETAK
jgi:anti-anti-sigma regulatory factor